MNYDSEIEKIVILNGGMMAKEIKDHTFTLVEYLMIVMIVGILVVFIVPFTQANKAQPKIREMKNNVNSILEAYDQVGVVDELKLSRVGTLNNSKLTYSMEVSNFLKYVNFEKDFAKNHLNFAKKKDYIKFLETEVRPLVKVAYLAKYDKYVQDLELVKLKFDYDTLPNLGSFLEDDKFFEYYDLAQTRLIDFVTPGLEEGFNKDIIQLINFVKGLKPVDDKYQLTYDQIKNFTNINLVDLSSVNSRFFAFKLNRDSTIVATTTDEFGTAGAQIVYDMGEEIYEIGNRTAYSNLGAKFLDESIAKLPALSQDRDSAIAKFKTQVNPEDYDLSVDLISNKDKELLLSFEEYIKDNFRYQDVEIYLEFYKTFDSTITNAINSNKSALESAVEAHDRLRNPTANSKATITQRVSNWEKLTSIKAKLDNRIENLNEINSSNMKVETAKNNQSLKENYLKSFNVIDQDWLILE